MNKNLKKVISTVAALAISASAVSAFAVDFPDVPADSNYYQAVQELSALGIISGFDDGTFRPDELVTRAQITKMIVDALAETESAEASKANSKFADVSADHWAKGYINQGVADEFIAGYSDTEFGPDDNVTYVQAQKMLVSAMGYETYAQNNGGWPNGYKLYAQQQGVTAGITGVADDQQLTRAQVARLIDNAMDAPVCVIDDYETLWNGSVVPKLKIKDTHNGTNAKDYQTLFTKKHDAYKVFGRVTATNRSQGGSVDTDKVKFDVEKSENFDDIYVTANNVQKNIDMYIGDTKADEMEQIYAEALVQKDSNDEWTILSINAAAAGKSVDLATDDFDKIDGQALKFFPAGATKNSVKYDLADTVQYYVNDVDYGTFAANSASDLKTVVDTYIDGNTTGAVTLMKKSNIGTTSSSSKYDVVYITVYSTAVVDQIVDRADTTRIDFKAQSQDLIKGSMTLQKDDDTYKYSFTLNGEAIDPTDLEQDDVLTIKFDRKNGFETTKFYDVLVSRDTAEGRYTGKNGDDGYKIDGTTYKFADKVGAYNFATSTDYTLYLDAFGKIANVDEISSSKKIGILKSVYRKNNGDYEVEIIDKDATVQTYTMDFNAGESDGAEAVAKKFTGGVAVDDSTYKSGLSKLNKDFYDQVVEYKVNSSNKLTIKTFMPARSAAYTDDTQTTAAKGTYKETSNRIGSLRLSSATTIIDLTGKDDVYKVITEDSLDDDSDYLAYGYDLNKSDSTYRYVLVEEGANKWNSKTQLAVFVESGTDTNEEGDEINTITVAYDGEEEDFVTLTLDEDYKTAPALYAGEPIIFRTTTSGDIDQIVKVFAETDGSKLFGGDYGTFKTAALAGIAAGADKMLGTLPTLTDNDETVKVQFGILVKDGNGVALAKVTGTENVQLSGDTAAKAHLIVDLDNAQSLVTTGAKVYTYDFSNGTKNNGRFVLDNAPLKTPDLNAAYVDKTNNNKYAIDVDGVTNDLVFAVVRTFDNDEAQEIYQIIRN